MNLGYQFENSIVQFNALLGQTDPPTDVSRTITDFRGDTVDQRKVREGNQFDRDNWEIGGDYEYDFSSGATFRALFLANDSESDFVRERFDVLDNGDDKDLFLRRRTGSVSSGPAIPGTLFRNRLLNSELKGHKPFATTDYWSARAMAAARRQRLPATCLPHNSTMPFPKSRRCDTNTSVFTTGSSANA